MKASNNKEEEPHFVKRDKFAITAEYKQWFADIKSRLRNSQIKAAIKVNSTLLEFYWSLGRDIVKMKAEQAWGSGVLQQLSFDLRDEFPGMKDYHTPTCGMRHSGSDSIQAMMSQFANNLLANYPCHKNSLLCPGDITLKSWQRVRL